MSKNNTEPDAAGELSPKQREIKARSARIVDAGFELFREEGWGSIRLEDIAERVGCTRGTLYNHFKNREEILLAMAERAIELRTDLFRAGIEAGVNSREKMLSVCAATIIYADTAKMEFAIEHSVRHETVWERSSESYRELFRRNEVRCMELVGKVIDDAVKCRDLPLLPGLTVAQLIERVAFGLYSMTYGGLVIQLTSPAMAEAGFRDPISTMHHNCNALVDSFGWQPLYEPLEYQAFLNRIAPPLKSLAQSRISGRKQSSSDAENVA